jgi:iron complex transport system substrate-binding protein
MKRSAWYLGIGLVILVIAVAILLFRPRVMPPPGSSSTVKATGSRPLAPTGDWPRTWPDRLGEPVTLPAPAQRLIALSPNLAEIVCAVGACDQLVAVTEFCDYPPAAAAKPKVGGIINPDLEKILSVDPDLLLIAHGVDLQVVKRVRELGVPVASFDPTSLQAILDVITRVGEMSGHEAEAAQLTTSLQEKTKAVRDRAALRKAGPRVLLMIAWDGLWVAGVQSFGNDAIETAGGVNALRSMPGVDQTKAWPQIPREALVVGAPEVVVFAGDSAQPALSSGETLLERLRRDPVWAELPAVQQGKVLQIDDDLITIPSPRLWEGLELLSQGLASAPANPSPRP